MVLWTIMLWSMVCGICQFSYTYKWNNTYKWNVVQSTKIATDKYMQNRITYKITKIGEIVPKKLWSMVLWTMVVFSLYLTILTPSAVSYGWLNPRVEAASPPDN